MTISSVVVNTPGVSGWTSPIQWTKTTGGSTLEFYTPWLQATTLSGMIVANIRALQSNSGTNATVRLEVAITDADGIVVNVWGAANANQELQTSETAITVYVAGPDVSIIDGQRLRFRFYLDDFEGPIQSGRTATLYYNGATPDASGDTYIILSVTLTNILDQPYTLPKVLYYDSGSNTYISETYDAHSTTESDVFGPYHYTTGA